MIYLFASPRTPLPNSRLTWAQTAMAANAPMLTKVALVDGEHGAGILPTGQVVGVIDEMPTVAQLLEAIMQEAHDVLTQLTPPASEASP